MSNLLRRRRLSILFLALLVALTTPSPSAKGRVLYLVTATPVDVGLKAGNELCLAVDPNDVHGMSWWNAGRSGCSTRSSSIVSAALPMVTRTSATTIDVRFRLELKSKPPSHRDVALAIENDTVRGVSGTPVPILRRSDLEIPMLPACCKN